MQGNSTTAARPWTCRDCGREARGDGRPTCAVCPLGVTASQPQPAANWQAARTVEQCSVCGDSIHRHERYLAVPTAFIVLCRRCGDGTVAA